MGSCFDLVGSSERMLVHFLTDYVSRFAVLCRFYFYFNIFGTVGLYMDLICCVFFKHGFVHAFKCSDWLCPSTLFFARHHRDTLGSLFPETTRCGTSDSGDKRVQSTEPDMVSIVVVTLYIFT